MSKSTNMLRTRRRDNNIKPNRRDSRLARLDRKSSRGMIYENEELRLKTININAEIERGQYDIKKLKRENEMLKKEIWCLRDEYEKLDKLLKEKDIDFSSSTSASDSDTCSSCSDESEHEQPEQQEQQQVEQCQNLENVQKTNLKKLQNDFDHLSIVPEENSTENSDIQSLNQHSQWNNQEPTIATTSTTSFIKPDECYENYQIPIQKQNFYNNHHHHHHKPVHFFSTIKPYSSPQQNDQPPIVISNYNQNSHFYQQKNIEAMDKNETDLIVKLDNQQFHQNHSSESTYTNDGNLEELVNDLELLSKDILTISNQQQQHEINQKPFKSELNVVLMPNPMPLIGFEKYKNFKNSLENLNQLPQKPTENLQNVNNSSTPLETDNNPFIFHPQKYENNCNSDNGQNIQRLQQNCEKDKNSELGSKMNLLEITSSEQISSDNDENQQKLNKNSVQKAQTVVQTTKLNVNNNSKSPKMSIRRKVSIHFKGKKDKTKQGPIVEHRKSIFDRFNPLPLKREHKTLSLESKNTTSETIEPKTPTSSDSGKKKCSQSQRKSLSTSPERTKHVQVKDESLKKHKKHKRRTSEANSLKLRARRGTVGSLERLNHRDRSFSICTDRSNNLLGMHQHRLDSSELLYDSERERTNSLSSCDTVQRRKLSAISNVPLSGKVPWCGCWGTGCI